MVSDATTPTDVIANESRVLLLPPTSRDAEAIVRLLRSNNITCQVCASMQHLCAEIGHGVSVLILAEEAVVQHAGQLKNCINTQAVWSDLPILVLSRAGSESPLLSNAIVNLGNVSVVERPVRLSTFLSLVRTSLRARTRQYEVRQHLLEIDRTSHALVESGARFKTLFDGIEDGFCIIEILFDESHQPIDYRFLESNPAFSKLTGLENSTGRTALEMVPTLEKRWVETYGSVAITGEPVRFENYAAPMKRWFDVYAFSFGLRENNQVAVFFRNVTERKKTETELLSAKQRIESSLLAGEVGTYYWDIPTDRVTGDRNFVAMFGVLPDENSSSPVGDFLNAIHPDDLPAVSAGIQATLNQNTPYQAEYRIRHSAGDRWVIARGTVDRDDAGKPIGWAGVIVDITDRKLIEQERQTLLESESAARAQAERASRMKDEFLATLSHELRTPLNAILGWSQIMQTSRDEEDLTSGLEVIERNARAQAQIIEDLLDMSRIISGKVRLEIKPIDLVAIIHNAVETARPTAQAKNIRLQAIIDPSTNMTGSGDGNRLQQVMWNLLTNAIKFTPKGGRVQVSLRRIESHLEIDVTDTGEGIAPEFVPFMFDRFRQADASTTRKHGGRGLGLSIVQQLVELHGGSVRASSDGLGKGATFTVQLPLSALRIEPEPQTPRRATRESVAKKIAADPCVELNGLRVLVVDDEPDARNLIHRLLKDCDAHVTTAGSAEEAVNLIGAQPFDMMISDIGMPGENGYGLIRRVRALKDNPSQAVPAIALTAYARTEDRVKALSAGFQHHLSKPVDPAELIALVATIAPPPTSRKTSG